jgi:RNA polymerase sigma-70 factor (ECF subfamily)
MAPPITSTAAMISDEDVVRRVLAGEMPLYEVLMRRYNQRLYRIVRAILRDEDEVIDVMQDTYVRAYFALHQFAGKARFSTWLSKIALHEALRRSRKGRRLQPLVEQPNESHKLGNVMRSADPTPEQEALHRETTALIEAAIDALPARYRPVFMLREVECLSTSETAVCLQLTEETVRVRLLRARKLLRDALYRSTGAKSVEAFEFGAARCDAVVRNVFETIHNPVPDL